MPTTIHREPIAASADTVWSLVGAFGDGSWHDLEVTCVGEGLGAVRKVSMPNGIVTELCDVHDPDTRTVGYSILENNPFPAFDYHGLIHVQPLSGSTCELKWSATYETDEDEVKLNEDLSKFLRGAARAVKKHAESL